MDSLTEKQVRLDDLMPLFREQLEKGKTIRFSPRGTSMLPMLRQGQDQVELSPLPEKLCRFDIPFYQRDNGQYVLHRIIEVKGETYTCLGDNQFQKEYGVRADQMIAVMTAFYRDGARHTVTEWPYRLYSRIWYYTRHFRYLWRRGMGFLRRQLK